MSNLRVQELFKRPILNNISPFIISQDYYELRKKTTRANGIVYQIFKLNSYKDVQNLNHEKAIMNLTLNDFKYLISTCWNKIYQPPPLA